MNASTTHWLLPEYLSDVLPAQARRMEELRRQALDLYHNSGFELVSPPLLEYADSLLVGQSQDLARKTAKLMDPLSGRSMGLRADMTSQVTRIDAHLLNREGVTRLCYCGPVFHVLPSDVLKDREMLQIGAEIFGYAGYQADLQLIDLAIKTLELAGVKDIQLDLSHPGVIHALVQADPQLQENASAIFDFVREKDIPSLQSFLAKLNGVPAYLVKALVQLPRLYGDAQVIELARQVLPDLPGVQQALHVLQSMVQHLHHYSIDLSDIRGYSYHSGVSFSLYANGWYSALVRGGRYDHVSQAYGRMRAATGFSLDLRQLVQGLPSCAVQGAILAPWGYEPELLQIIDQLRQKGLIVVQAFPNSDQKTDEYVFTQTLVKEQGQWQVQDIPSSNAD